MESTPVTPNNKVLFIPEIISMVINELDTKNQKSACLVCKDWNNHASIIIWRQVVVPEDWYSQDLTQLYPVLDRHRKNIRSLKLQISSDEKKNSEYDSDSIEDPLGELLSRMPNLESLQLQVPSGTNSALVYVISCLSKKLKQLDTGLMEWNPKNLEMLLKSCPDLCYLYGHHFTTQDLQAIASTQPAFQGIGCTHPRFEENELVLFAKQVPELTQLSMSFHQFLTSSTLIGIASHCSKLERLEFHFCLSIGTGGFEALFKASRNLRILDLGPSEVRDEDITILATNCPKLEFLRLPYCGGLTHVGIASIVHSCPKLEVLDINWCHNVSLAMFDDEKPWVCKDLRYLDISGINANSSADEMTTAQSLEKMYRQMSSLTQLQNLSLSGHDFSLRLIEIGLPYLAQLRKLDTLYLLKQKDSISWDDLITIGNLFPNLKQLEFQGGSILQPSPPPLLSSPLSSPPTDTSCPIKDDSVESTTSKRFKTETSELKVNSTDSSTIESSSLPSTCHSEAEAPSLHEPQNIPNTSSKRKRSATPPINFTVSTSVISAPVERALGETGSSTTHEANGAIETQKNTTILKATLTSGLEISVELGDEEDGLTDDMMGWRPVDSGFIFTKGLFL
ncbi:hypothetical protein BGZ76_009578 [Entomortierella beljakovae]|nr:hypothetical protein BGZ76_009578 [Entomortierella beljakovae]